jgi:hypothetical protein
MEERYSGLFCLSETNQEEYYNLAISYIDNDTKFCPKNIIISCNTQFKVESKTYQTIYLQLLFKSKNMPPKQVIRNCIFEFARLKSKNFKLNFF